MPAFLENISTLMRGGCIAAKSEATRALGSPLTCPFRPFSNSGRSALIRDAPPPPLARSK